MVIFGWGNECKAIPDLNEAPTNTDNVNATVLIQDSIEDPALGEDSDGASVDAWEIEHKMGPSDSEFDHMLTMVMMCGR